MDKDLFPLSHIPLCHTKGQLSFYFPKESLPKTPCVFHSVSTKLFSVDKKNQLDVTFCILYFSSNSCSTCFGQPCAHHQELTTADAVPANRS